MSSRGRAIARQGQGGVVRPLGLLLVLVPFIVAMAAGIVSAGPPAPASTLSAEDLARARGQIGLVRHTIGTAVALEVVLPSRSTSRQLALAPDGRTTALADQYGPLAAVLTLARDDGSQTRVNLPGLIGAAFAPGGAWLAVIDGRGALWRVAALSGTASLVADGPFIGSPIARADGTLLLLAVPSVSAPISSVLVRLNPETGTTEPLSDDRLVYGAFSLSDGTLAVAAHEAGRTVVRRVATGRSALFADLGEGAIDVAVAPDGEQIAFVRDDKVFYLRTPDASPRFLARGRSPAFAPDGTALMIQSGGETSLLTIDGAVLATYQGQAGFIACAQECQP